MPCEMKLALQNGACLQNGRWVKAVFIKKKKEFGTKNKSIENIIHIKAQVTHSLTHSLIHPVTLGEKTVPCKRERSTTETRSNTR